MLTDVMPALAIPMSGWADRQLAALSIEGLSGADLLSERALLNGFNVPGRQSSGGGCRLYDTRDGHIALSLTRLDDRELLPALFGDADVEIGDDQEIAARIAHSNATELVSKGRELGLAVALIDERPTGPACVRTTEGLPVATSKTQPLVVDLSALWAGPLASRLLRLTGARVVKVESSYRPDGMRAGDAGFFARLNDGKELASLDPRTEQGRGALLELLARADFVIEAARPRALKQLGIDADSLVRATPGLIWITITGHGIAGDAGNWIAFGDDAAVAGGLSAALREATGQIGFVGDAFADPLTGIFAARIAMEQRRRGVGARFVVSMSGVVAEALAEERARDGETLDATLRHWAASAGRPWPC